MGTASRTRLAAALLLGLVLVLLSRPVQAGDTTPAPTFTPLTWAVPQPDEAVQAAQSLLELVNRTRWQHGQLPPLKSNPALSRAALAHSRDMAQNDFFSHESSTGSSPWDRIDAAGYGNWYVLAENIAAGHKTPAEVLQAWMESPSHRENLLNREVNEVGIGYILQADDAYPGSTWGYGHYWTMDMGTRWDAFPLVIAGESYSTTSRLVQLYLYGMGWATQMRLSNDGVTWSDWQAYRPIPTWELATGNGLKHVYGQVRDSQGLTMSSEDEIWLGEAPAPPPGPTFEVHPRQAVFVIRQGQSQGQPPHHQVQIIANDGQAHAWHASWDQEWLRLKTSPALPPAEPILALTGGAGSLPAGVYSATLSIWDDQDRVEVPVQLYVFPRLYSLYLPLALNRSVP